MVVSRDEALALLRRDLPRYEARVAKALPAAGQAAFDAAVSFDFNTGAIHRASWVKAFRRGDAAGARAGLMLWVRAGGRALPGLVAVLVALLAAAALGGFLLWRHGEALRRFLQPKVIS